MADKRIRDLVAASSVSAGDVFPFDNTSGNSRKVTAARLKTFCTETIAASLATHLADTTTHGITTYMATLLANESLADLLTDLGFVTTGVAGNWKVTFPGGFTIAAKRYTLSGTGSEAKAYGQGHTYTSLYEAICTGDDGTEGVSVWLNGGDAGASTATVRWALDTSVTVTLISFGV